MGKKDELEVETEGLLGAGQQQVLDSLTYRMLQELGYGVEAYPGTVTPGATGLQQQAFDTARGYVRGGGEQAHARDAAIERALSGESAYDIDPAAREAVYAANEAQAYRDYDMLSRGITERLGGGGRGGGVYQALANAGGELTEDLAALRADLEYKDELSRREGLESAAGRQIGAVDTALSAGAFDLNTLLGVGGAQRDITGQQNLEDYYDWLATQPYNNPWLGLIPTTVGTPTLAHFPGVLQGQDYGGLVGTLGAAAIGAAASSRAVKDKVADLDIHEVLSGVRSLDLDRWRYKAQPDGPEHIGAYAEEFRDAFGIGDGRVIDLVDGLGIAYAAIQALAEEVDALKRVRAA